MNEEEHRRRRLQLWRAQQKAWGKPVLDPTGSDPLRGTFGSSQTLLEEGEKAAEDIAAGLEVVAWMNKVREVQGVLSNLKDPAFRDEVHRVAEIVKSEVKSVAYDEFEATWKWARQLVSLQARLYLEQVFFELGGDWRNRLVTGFKPVGLVGGREPR